MADFTTPIPGSRGGAGPAVQTVGDGGSAGLIDALKQLANRDMWLSIVTRLAHDSKSFFNPAEFSRPSSQGDWIARVSSNASRFAYMYTLFFLPIMLRSVLSSLWLRLGAIAVAGVWVYGYGVKRADEVLVCFNVPLPKVLCCACLSVLIMLLTGMLNALIGALLVFSIVGMPHMSLHMAPGSDAIDAIELQPVVAGSA